MENLSEPQSIDCAICLDDFNQNPTETLPCGHTFHIDCITPWLIIRTTCPVCRSSTRETDGEDVYRISTDTRAEAAHLIHMLVASMRDTTNTNTQRTSSPDNVSELNVDEYMTEQPDGSFLVLPPHLIIAQFIVELNPNIP